MANPSKPFLVTANYLINPEPSTLSSPFNLTATFDATYSAQKLILDYH
jgi:hypothetical protein